MEWIVNYWYLGVSALAMITFILVEVIRLSNMPTVEQIDQLEEWLRYAVTMAERELGSGTGQLKLRYVYDLALSKFTWLSKLMSFESFAFYVDNALVWLRLQLESNENLKLYVEGGVVEEDQ